MDLLLLNANVLTMEGRKAGAVAFHHGRIARVGDSKTLRGEASPGCVLLDYSARELMLERRADHLLVFGRSRGRHTQTQVPLGGVIETPQSEEAVSSPWLSRPTGSFTRPRWD